MSTNFYWKPNDEGLYPHGRGTFDPDDEHPTDPKIHIGKRSAAGLYCWDCEQPLVARGMFGRTAWRAEAIHGSNVVTLERCPVCSALPSQQAIGEDGHPAGIELGFAKPLSKRPTGVSGASSFSWAQEPAHVLQCCFSAPQTTLVEDEYGHSYTGAEFLDLILLVPLWWTDSVGEAFS